MDCNVGTLYVGGIMWHFYTYTHDHFLDMLHVVNSYKKNHGLCISRSPTKRTTHKENCG